MINIRKAGDRGHFDHGWLNTYHTFSFADYHDPAHMGFRSLRVINEDRVHPGEGFGMHPHRDMEIITYILEGELTHKDSMGNGSVIAVGDLQRMTAGTGILHSEFNDSKREIVHLLQIWILPDRKGLTPEYEQKAFAEKDKIDNFCLLASPDGRDGSLTIHQDAFLHGAVVFPGINLIYDLEPTRHAWIQVARGIIEVNGTELNAGDGASVTEESEIRITGREKAEILLFDLA